MQTANIIKIVFTGPESTGKTTLAKQLAEHFQTVWNAEYARSYLGQLGRPYKQEDILEIARGQLRNEDELLSKANRILFCDTALLVPKVWSIFKYGHVAPPLLKLLQERNYDFYFLCEADLPWEYDPLRESPNDRELLATIYRQELSSMSAPFVSLHGNLSERRQNAIATVNRLFAKS